MYGDCLERSVSVNFSDTELLDTLRDLKEIESPFNILNEVTGLSSENYEKTLMFLGGLSITFGRIKEKNLSCYTSDEWEFGKTTVTMLIDDLKMEKKVFDPVKVLRYLEEQLLENHCKLGTIEKLSTHETQFLDKRLLAEAYGDGRFVIRGGSEHTYLNLNPEPVTKTPEGVYALIKSIEETFSHFPGKLDRPLTEMKLVYNRCYNKQVYEGILGSIVLSSYSRLPMKTVVRFPQSTVL